MERTSRRARRSFKCTGLQSLSLRASLCWTLSPLAAVATERLFRHLWLQLSGRPRLLHFHPRPHQPHSSPNKAPTVLTGSNSSSNSNSNKERGVGLGALGIGVHAPFPLSSRGTFFRRRWIRTHNRHRPPSRLLEALLPITHSRTHRTAQAQT